jgi:hypothetical protein
MSFTKTILLTAAITTATLASGGASASTAPTSLALGKAPTRITMAVEIDAPIADVWESFANIGDIYLNSPTVSTSALSSDIQRGVGATRHMEMSLKKGATLDERVIQWDEGRSMELEVYEIHGVMGVQTMGGDFRLEEKGGVTVLTSTLNYSMTNGFFGFMNDRGMNKKFAGLWTSVLAGYKHHIETGTEVTPTTALNLDAVRLIGIEAG